MGANLFTTVNGFVWRLPLPQRRVRDSTEATARSALASISFEVDVSGTSRRLPDTRCDGEVLSIERISMVRSFQINNCRKQVVTSPS